MSQTIGKVTATESNPTTCTKVKFWVADGIFIRPFDIVRIQHVSRNHGVKSHSYATVTDLSYITDSAGHLANFISSDFGEVTSDPLNARLGTTLAEATVLGNSDDIELPLRDGAPVEWATEQEILQALGLHSIKRPIPAGFMQTSNNLTIPVSFDWQYLIGPEAAHFNVSGISGLAAKTSYTMYLLSAIQQKAEEYNQGVSLVIFNVKGHDLLAVNEDNPDLHPRDREHWKKCGLEPKPLRNVRFLYPFSSAGNNQRHADTSVPLDVLERQEQQKTAFRYYYDVHTFIGGESGDDEDVGGQKLSLLLADIEDPHSTLHSIYQEVGSFRAETWDDFYKELRDKTQKGGPQRDISVQSWRKFSRLIHARLKKSPLFTATNPLHKYRQTLFIDQLKDFKKGQVLVIDIAELPTYLQCLVVGDVTRTLFDAKLGLIEEISSDELGKIIVFVDELNKFAPKIQGGGAGTGPLTRWLLEISERGRSLGVILFGAEQFRSGVHERILGNCATGAHGRTNPVELNRAADYKQMLSTSQRDNLTRLKQGEMLIQHPLFRTPMLKVQFPNPAYLQLKD